MKTKYPLADTNSSTEITDESFVTVASIMNSDDNELHSSQEAYPDFFEDNDAMNRYLW